MLSAEFESAVEVEAAVVRLRDAGVEPGRIELFSAKPVELGPGLLDRPSRMSLWGVIGAVLNGVLATAFVLWAQSDYPLVTGGMPIRSAWSIGVVVFEMVMAGAVVGIFLAFLVESGLLSGLRPGNPTAPPPGALDDDTIYLQVNASEAEAVRLQEALDGFHQRDSR